MTTGYLLTCGTSLLGNLRRLDPEDSVGAVLGPALAAIAPDVRAAILPGHDEVFSYEPTLDRVLQDFAGMRGAVMRIAAEGGIPSGLRSLGVELESMVRRMCGQGPSGAEGLRADGPIALIVSDTPEGLTCGLLIASITGRSIRLLTHRGSPEETVNGWVTEEHEAHPDMDVAAAPVEVYVIPRLATGTEDAISEAAPWLAGALARTVGGVLKDGYWSGLHEVQAEISGGFKATLPLVHALLEYCAALRSNTRIMCVLRHETAPEVWIRAGLRRLLPSELDQRLVELREVRAGLDPEDELLRGFGWRYEDCRPVLTPEGLGILAFPQP